MNSSRIRIVCLGCGLTLALLATCYFGAIALGLRSFEDPMASRVHIVVRQNLAVALSWQFFKRPFDYAGYADVLDALESASTGASPTFQNARTIDAAIAAMAAGRITVDRSREMFLWGEDIGLSLYAAAAFRLLGPSLGSLFDLFFVLLALSSLVFLLQFSGTRVAWMLPAIVLLGIHASLPIYVLSPEISSVFSNRAIPVLGLVATLHLVLWMLLLRTRSGWSIAGIAFQAALLTLVSFARAAAAWQFLAVVLAALGCIGVAVWRERAKATPDGIVPLARRHWAILIPVVLLAAMATVKNLHVATSISPLYSKGGMASHSKWHMLFMGLTLNPDARQLNWEPNDQGVTDLAQKYHERFQRYFASQGMKSWEQDVSPWTTGKWDNYERVVRSMFIEFAVENPWFVVEAYGRKLLFAGAWLLMSIGVDPPAAMAKTGNADISSAILRIDGLRPWTFGPVAWISWLVTAGVFFARRDRTSASELAVMAWVLALLVGASLLPPIATAPIPHGMIDIAVGWNTLVAFSCAAGIAGLLEWLRRRRERHR